MAISSHPKGCTNAESNQKATYAWLQRAPRIEKLYRRYEKYIPMITFAVGFIWDSLTLTRIDRLTDNLVLLGYLAVLGITIILTIRHQSGQLKGDRIRKIEPHFLWIMQFVLGGLLSSYVVFYFKSVSWTQTQFFFIVLLGLFIGNEFLHERLGNPTLMATLLFFSLLSFFAFFLPIVFGLVNLWMFLLAGALSLTASLLVFILAYGPRLAGSSRQLRSVAVAILGTYGALNLLYFENLIPPVPLALKSAGIFHRVSKNGEGYEVAYVPASSWWFRKESDDPFYLSAGESAYCYTAIFAPSRIRIPIYHVWSRHESAGGWIRTDTISFDISGGREGGYRGFTKKHSLSPGQWRVEVETDRGQILGRIDFRVAASPVPHPPLLSRVIE